MNPLTAAAISIARRGSGGGRMLVGFGGRPLSLGELADAWVRLPPDTAPAHWAALAKEAGLPAPPTVEEQAAMIAELRSAERGARVS